MRVHPSSGSKTQMLSPGTWQSRSDPTAERVESRAGAEESSHFKLSIRTILSSCLEQEIRGQERRALSEY